MAEGHARVIGTGNGDPSDDFDATGNVRRAFSGLARAIVKAGTTARAVRVLATAPGLEQGSVSFQLRV